MGKGSLVPGMYPDPTGSERRADRRKFSVSEPLGERSLTKPEKRKLKSLEKKTPKKSFKDQYGKEKGEEVYYATLTKRAKEEA